MGDKERAKSQPKKENIMTSTAKKKYEAKFATKFRNWARRMGMPTAAYELKHTRRLLEFNCRELKEHQYFSLLAAASSPLPLVYKIPDDGVAQKPFDMIGLNKVPAYVVICFPKAFALVPIRSWPLDVKRMTLEDASKIAEKVVPLSEL